MNALDARIVNRLQAGVPVTDRPFLALADSLGLDEAVLIDRIEALLRTGVLSRFGPMYNVDAFGGAYSLCAMAVPAERFDEVSATVNRHPEVAHNYARDHRLNMWFVVAVEDPAQIPVVIAAIETQTGLTVLDLPKEEEYCVGLHLDALDRDPETAHA